jgi:hypothetical protein
MTHGILSKLTVLAHEDQAAFDALLAALIEEHLPSGMTVYTAHAASVPALPCPTDAASGNGPAHFPAHLNSTFSGLSPTSSIGPRPENFAKPRSREPTLRAQLRAKRNSPLVQSGHGRVGTTFGLCCTICQQI